MEPNFIKGSFHKDQRGTLSYNNEFDSSEIKRIYVIENNSIEFIRGWQGHQIEQRWFSAISGTFQIELIKIDNWENPSKSLNVSTFLLKDEELNILHVPKGYVTSIQALTIGAKLLVMADYLIGEIKDEFRYELDYFNH